MPPSTWDTLQIPNSEISTIEEALPELAAPNPHFSYSDESFCPFDNLNPTCDFLYTSHQPFTCIDPFVSLAHPTFSTEDYNILPCPKRQKFYEEEQQPLFSSLQDYAPSSFLDHNFCYFDVEQVPPEILCSMEFKLPPKKESERTISAQSIAARERRRKIIDKTQELGKLIPGGPKMNTAEMLSAAAKYVNYLQAQVQMLQLIKTFSEDKAGSPIENLHALVVSPFVQEKLYLEQRCFVPKEFVITLTNHNNVQSRPTIVKDLKELIGADTEKKAL
ncbi:transcription factor bHLH53-like [Abrus precatorius]|uniref:Transcription factor bHLH53-like n=1 Tax=Abrus precatorius TaxID=3816 RepID=A0A8B8KGQ6_ABRPR|nr:transcription factor bHLH53-like [Abrus precatorius]